MIRIKQPECLVHSKTPKSHGQSHLDNEKQTYWHQSCRPTDPAITVTSDAIALLIPILLVQKSEQTARVVQPVCRQLQH